MWGLHSRLDRARLPYSSTSSACPVCTTKVRSASYFLDNIAVSLILQVWPSALPEVRQRASRQILPLITVPLYRSQVLLQFNGAVPLARETALQEVATTAPSHIELLATRRFAAPTWKPWYEFSAPHPQQRAAGPASPLRLSENIHSRGAQRRGPHRRKLSGSLAVRLPAHAVQATTRGSDLEYTGNQPDFYVEAAQAFANARARRIRSRVLRSQTTDD